MLLGCLRSCISCQYVRMDGVFLTLLLAHCGAVQSSVAEDAGDAAFLEAMKLNSVAMLQQLRASCGDSLLTRPHITSKACLAALRLGSVEALQWLSSTGQSSLDTLCNEDLCVWACKLAGSSENMRRMATLHCFPMEPLKAGLVPLDLW